METAQTSNERTPKNGNVPATNSQGKLFRRYCTSYEQTPLDGNDTASKEQASLVGDAAISNEKISKSGQATTSDPDANQLTISGPTTSEIEPNEVSLDEVVQALFSAWQRNRRPKKEITLDFFTTKELQAMHLAYQDVTRGRHCSSRPHLIAEGVATSVAKFLLPAPECEENDEFVYYQIEFAAKKNLLVVNLLREWDVMDEERLLPARYVQTIENPDEQPVDVSEFCLRLVELYDKIHDFIKNPKLQIMLHTLLFIWPVSILVIGSKHMECPMGHHLSYLMMALGCVGCLAILFRLALMYLTSKDEFPFFRFWQWNCVRLIEFTFLVVFIVQAVHFFSIDPTNIPDPSQCLKNCYDEALLMNYVSIALVSSYVLVYFITVCVKQFDIWHWIFRHL